MVSGSPKRARACSFSTGESIRIAQQLLPATTLYWKYNVPPPPSSASRSGSSSQHFRQHLWKYKMRYFTSPLKPTQRHIIPFQQKTTSSTMESRLIHHHLHHHHHFCFPNGRPPAAQQGKRKRRDQIYFVNINPLPKLSSARNARIVLPSVLPFSLFSSFLLFSFVGCRCFGRGKKMGAPQSETKL
jgi:hypothetical protein